MNSFLRSGDDVEGGSSNATSSTIQEALAREQREATVLKRRVLSAIVVSAGILGTSMVMTRNSGGLGAITDVTTNNNNDNTASAALKNTALKASSNSKDNKDSKDEATSYEKLIQSIKVDPFAYSTTATTTTTGTTTTTAEEVHVVDGLSGPSRSPSTGLHKPTWKPTVVTSGKPIEATGKPVETVITTDTTSTTASLPLPVRSMPADFDGSGTKAGKARGVGAGAGAGTGTGVAGGAGGLAGQGPRGGVSGTGDKGLAAGGQVGAVFDTPLRPVGAPLDTAAVTTNSMDAQSQLAAAAQQFSGDAATTSTTSTQSSSSSSATSGNRGEVGGALDGNGARGILPAWMKSVLGQATKQSGTAELALGTSR